MARCRKVSAQESNSTTIPASIFTANGIGFDGLFDDYKGFHNRQVARTVSSGDPEVTAKVVTLEDLRNAPDGWFAPTTSDSSQLIQTAFLDELALRKNLLPPDPTPWPPTKDGPLEGVLTTEVSIDRTGVVREVGPIVSDNSSSQRCGPPAHRSHAFQAFPPQWSACSGALAHHARVQDRSPCDAIVDLICIHR